MATEIVPTPFREVHARRQQTDGAPLPQSQALRPSSLQTRGAPHCRRCSGCFEGYNAGKDCAPVQRGYRCALLRGRLQIRSTAKPGIPGRAVGGVPRSRSDAVTIAVGMVAEIRASTRDSARSRSGACGILPRSRNMIVGAPVVGTPFPDVARHVVKSEAVRLEGCNRTGAGVPIIH